MKKLNFKESKEILKVIKKAKKILINLHRSPDLDSYSSSFSLYNYLKNLNKEVDVVVTSTSELSDQILSETDSKLIKYVDYDSFDFNKYDLMISPDSASWQQVVDNPLVKIPDIPIIVIDHHPTNEKFGFINLVRPKASSCAEVVYQLFQDFNYDVDQSMADLILTGIIADTGGFSFSDNPQTLRIAAELIELGAKKTEIINKLLRTKKIKVLKYWGECFSKLEVDRDSNFAWVATSYELENKFRVKKSDFSTMFLSIVDGTDFGVMMSEDEPKSIKISFRSRGNFDVSLLAKELGGGGHKAAAGAKIENLDFEKVVEKVLGVCRKYANKNI